MRFNATTEVLANKVSIALTGGGGGGGGGGIILNIIVNVFVAELQDCSSSTSVWPSTSF